ncbi:MAG TPA: phosphomannomutase/phosphoglucomutase [Aggregatilineales bacterium]|nr:phosphomannomutase/phosphoglucomutase [Aggregatilineales bacterium]
MTQVPTNIFRQYDIRGTVKGASPELTPNLALLVGKGYGTYMQRTFQTDHVFVGSDNRLSSPPLKKAVIEGIASTGLHVTDIGEVMTPTVYYASASYGVRGGGIQITGSHLTLEYNGIKMAFGKLALSGEQIQAILQLILKDDFQTGQGIKDLDLELVKRHMEKIASLVKLGPRKLKVVVDAGNGISGPYMPPVYEKLGIEVVCLYCESDGTFPNHLPNPEDPETTKDLEKAVVDHKADLGIGFDGDADRCGIIDERGDHIAADRLLALLARDMLTRHPNAKVVFDVKSSQVLFDEIKSHGGIPIMWKAGHSLMKAKIAEEGALLGGEVSGHMFIGEDYYGFDDAGLVSLKFLEIVSKTQQTVTQMFDSIPKLVATPEIIMSAPDDIKFDIINAMVKKLEAKYDVIDVDGARAVFPDGWGLVRASNTQPAITMRFEARTKPEVVEYMKTFDKMLDDYPQVDRKELRTQIAAFEK